MNRKMKVKTILTLALAATTLAACHRGKKPPRMDNSKLAISLSKPAKGDRAIYGLACLGCSDTALVLLPNGGGDPVRYNILDATRNHQVFGDIEVGDWVCVMPCEEKDEKNRADMVIDLDQLKATWTYPVMPKLRDVSHLSKRQQARILANVPIIFLTARDTENDTVTGFNIGADDYISKPFSIREVMVRVRAVLRRTAEQAGDADESKIINYQGLQLNLDKKTVSIDGEAIPFTKTEFELLRLFLEERGKVFSRQELIDRVWPKDVMVLDRTVDVNITRMRKKIGKFAKCIVTRLGFGYYFDA